MLCCSLHRTALLHSGVHTADDPLGQGMRGAVNPFLLFQFVVLPFRSADSLQSLAPDNSNINAKAAAGEAGDEELKLEV